MASAAPAGRADSSLQWGRDRSGAEMASLLRDVCETVRLQWGRDRSVAEMRAGCNGARVVRGASMGPRPIGRGNVAERVGERRGDGASMGPRPIGRGNAAKLFPFIQDRQLQWGRDRSVAEIQRTYATSRSAFVLQWGRDRSVAEINKFGSEHWFDDGFNGAATDRSRKYPPRPKPVHPDHASMGPRPIGRGNS